MKKMLSLLLAFTLAFALLPAAAFADAQSDGDVLVDLPFDGGSTEDFMIYTNGGSCDISNKDGALDVSIENVGTLDYANQVYYDGFALTEGVVYTYSFDISSDLPRQVEYRIQLNGGDYHAYQGEFIEVGNDVLHFSVDWTMAEASDPAPRIVFNMGKMTDMDGDVPAHHIYIDNIRLTVKDASNAAEDAGGDEICPLAVNQLGFRTGDVKTVTLKTDGTPAEEFSVIRDDDGSEVLKASFTEAKDDAASGGAVQSGEFSELSEAGTYHIECAVGGETLSSPSFVIDDAVYGDLYKEVFLMLYRQRCGIETDPAIAGDDFAHAACHTGEALDPETGKTYDVSGGWHDAGDYGRYVVSGAKTVLDLLMAYEDYNAKDDDLGIPESGNDVPDLLDEARFELEWMLKMQNPDNGGVWHKVTCRSFPGEVPPEEETEELVLSPVSVAATADFAAVCASASVTFAEIDADFSEKLLNAAEKAWSYLENAEDEGFRNPSDVSTGEYPDEDLLDERLLAAVELQLAGAELPAEELTALAKEASEQSDSGMPDPALGWAKMNSYTLHDLERFEAMDTEQGIKDGPLSGIADALRSSHDQTSESFYQAIRDDGYHMALGTDYPWGSNMTVANNGMLILFDRLAESNDYSISEVPEEAMQQLDYLLGENPTGYCYVTGFGTHSPEHPHHRPSQSADLVMPGMLVGGPDNALEDPYAQAVLADAAPAMCYVDNEQSYSTNEVTVYWNSPLIYLLTAVTHAA